MRMMVLAAAVALGVAGMSVAQPALAQAEGNRNGATGGSVIAVSFPGGEFRRQADGSWNEYGADGRVTFRFREAGRDDWSVYLAEIGSDKQVQLDLYRMRIGISQGGAPMSDLYVITSARAPSAVSLPSALPASFRVRRVDFRDGYFQAERGGGWTEYRSDGSVAFRFEMRMTSEDAITLFDASRGTGVELNLTRRMIRISFNGSPYEDLYPITAITPPVGGTASTPPRPTGPIQTPPVRLSPGAIYATQTLFKIEAGPITSQGEANAKCPALAARVRGSWTQGWERRDGVNSVCVIAFPQ